ncbi:MAG: hypothetical protein ACRDHL_11000, partial [Candidatus Promineifilaceae bacterium]
MSQAKSSLAGLLVALAVALWASLAAAGLALAQETTFEEPAAAASAAAEWLAATHQNDDGGFTSFSTGA